MWLKFSLFDTNKGILSSRQWNRTKCEGNGKWHYLANDEAEEDLNSVSSTPYNEHLMYPESRASLSGDNKRETTQFETLYIIFNAAYFVRDNIRAADDTNAYFDSFRYSLTLYSGHTNSTLFW